MAPTNPTTVVLVPGAWHNPVVYDVVAHNLRKEGYSTSYVCLPSVGPKEFPKDWSLDVQAIAQKIEAASDAGNEVILVAHSYGSLPACEAVKGLTLADRKEAGKKGGVAHVFFCCSFVIPEGKSLIQAFGGNDLPWFRVSEDKMSVDAADPQQIVFNDLPQDVVDANVAALDIFSYQCFYSPVTYAAWRHVPSTYLYCLQDQAIPMFVQKMMVEEWAKGVDFRTETLDSSHSPFLSKPDEMAAAIRRAAGESVQ